jgi:hypothetical protein
MSKAPIAEVGALFTVTLVGCEAVKQSGPARAAQIFQRR